ncbi:RNA polymerase sigma-70 factor (ECF subfamily) [Tahibacter aquaticus]|uniref:RNA polymerase sigma-70 factor (ECF subfamily) n=1 Tax=Tahibacter aquaticus TaxID=520092 RepID=A0A4R6Z4Q6_9GAMM|nr:RNA polymerase sigma-70 factor (ECF subfamily) [Tahibacter aquaticus]
MRCRLTIGAAPATIRPAPASRPNVDRSNFAIDVPESLLQRAQGGELRAFEQIYRLFERPVYTLALRLLNDADAAREILHDAMLKLFQRLDQFRGDSPFWGWLRQIVLNEALMRLRKDKRLEFDASYDEIETETAPPWVHADGLVLEKALGHLPALTRSVLWLYHVEGYSHPEIADALGKSVSFSKSQVARGTARLRNLLDSTTESRPCLIANPQPS